MPYIGEEDVRVVLGMAPSSLECYMSAGFSLFQIPLRLCEDLHFWDLVSH